MIMFSFLYFLLILTSVNSEPDADKQFQQFHRGYEREATLQKLKAAQIRRDAPVKEDDLEKRLVPYSDGNSSFTGYVAYSKNTTAHRPVVVVVHDWDGRDAFENGKAEALAKLGYVGFALDLFGKTGSNQQENQALMKPYRENRPLLLRRLRLAVDEVKKIAVADQSKIGAIGFCFGGMGVLDMARGGLESKGVVSFHGALAPLPPSQQLQQENIPVKAKILVLHGHDDPGIPPSAVEAFEQEMTRRKADWQVHIYSNTVHGFTVPTANSTGSMYNPLSAKRSWLAMKDFFEEVFL